MGQVCFPQSISLNQSEVHKEDFPVHRKLHHRVPLLALSNNLHKYFTAVIETINFAAWRGSPCLQLPVGPTAKMSPGGRARAGERARPTKRKVFSLTPHARVTVGCKSHLLPVQRNTQNSTRWPNSSPSTNSLPFPPLSASHTLE